MNSGYKNDEPDENNNSATSPNNGLGSGLSEQKGRSLSIHQPLPVLNKRNQSKLQMMKSLFSIQNAVKMYKGVIKRREGKAHILLWLNITIYMIAGICANGMAPIMLGFVQKTYEMKTDLFLVRLTKN